MLKLKVDDIHKRYGEHEVLKGISLQASAGDVISIIGASGSGKSTFCAALISLNAHIKAPSASTAKRWSLCPAPVPAS